MVSCAQMGARLGCGGSGPEQKSQMAAGRGSLTVQQRTGQRRLQARDVDSGHRLVGVDQAEYAQQASAQNVHGYPFAGGQLQPSDGIKHYSTAAGKWQEDSAGQLRAVVLRTASNTPSVPPAPEANIFNY